MGYSGRNVSLDQIKARPNHDPLTLALEPCGSLRGPENDCVSWGPSSLRGSLDASPFRRQQARRLARCGRGAGVIAEEILAERSSIRLSPDAAAAFNEALERPAAVNERLARALRRERTFSWVD